MEVPLVAVKQELLECSYCEKKFVDKARLKNHLKTHFKKEPDGELCEKCSKVFRNSYHLNKHLQKCDNKYTKKKRFVCGICGLETVYLENHYKNQHNIKVEKECYEFNSKDIFLKWKEDIERQTVARFVKCRGTAVDKQGVRRSYFNCHRGGFFVKRGKNLRQFKATGTNKINGHCPAAIVLRESQSKILATFIKTHVGHESDFKRIPLSTAEKELIARKLVDNVSIDDILTEVKDSISDDNVSRIHFINRKDIHNILTRHKLCKKLKEKDDDEVNHTCVKEYTCEPSSSKEGNLDCGEHITDEYSNEIEINVKEEPLEVVLVETNSVDAESLQELNLLVSKQFGRSVKLTLPKNDKCDELNFVVQESFDNEVDHQNSAVVELVDRNVSELPEESGESTSYTEYYEVKENSKAPTQTFDCNKTDTRCEIIREPEVFDHEPVPERVVYFEYKLSQDGLSLKQADTESLESLREQATEQFHTLLETADSKEKLLLVLDQITQLKNLVTNVVECRPELCSDKETN